MYYTAYYDSPVGMLTMVSNGTNLVELSYGKFVYDENRELPVFGMTRRWLDIYFAGKCPDFTPPLALQGTPFRKKVWNILLAIPYGKTVTYGEIARRFSSKMSAQAIGGAVGHNPVSIIVPCHRVIGADGSLTGYGGGLDRKEKLLRLEKAI